MPTYRVNWSIDWEADSPRAAAEAALRIQRDPSSIATVFEVQDPDGCLWEIDLLDASADGAEPASENQSPLGEKGECNANPAVP